MGKSPPIASAQIFLTVANHYLLICSDLKYKSDTMRDTIRDFLRDAEQLKTKMQEGLSYSRQGSSVPISLTSFMDKNNKACFFVSMAIDDVNNRRLELMKEYVIQRAGLEKCVFQWEMLLRKIKS